MQRLTDVVKNLIIINVIVFFGAMTIPEVFQSYIEMGKMFFFKSDFFRPFQLFTSMFMHADIMHLLMNMLGLYFLGPTVERTLGSKRFFILYFMAGLGGSFLHQAVEYYHFTNLPCVECEAYYNFMQQRALGASGAIYGVVIAFMTMYPNEKLMIIPIPIPIKAMYLGFGMVGIALFFGLTDNEPGGFAHFAHLGGAIVGFLLIHYWNMVKLR